MKVVLATLAFALGLAPALAGAELPQRGAAASRPAGTLTAAVARAAAVTPLRPESTLRKQPVESERPHRSWIGRHPALFGLLAGAGTGAVIGATAGHPSNDENWSTRSGMVFFGTATGAGLGALTGWVIGLVRD